MACKVLCWQARFSAVPAVFIVLSFSLTCSENFLFEMYLSIKNSELMLLMDEFIFPGIKAILLMLPGCKIFVRKAVLYQQFP